MTGGPDDDQNEQVLRELQRLAAEGRVSPKQFKELEARFGVKFNYRNTPAKVTTIIHPPAPDDDR